MISKPLTIKVPGKLMIAGEFAVLEPRQKLVAMAVDRFVYASLVESEVNHITLESLDLVNVPWLYDNQIAKIKTDDPRVRFVEFAMETALNYLGERSISPQRFALSIRSELNDDESGIKYGLGSSAAVVTAVITVVLQKYLPEPPSADLIFKLAAISHVITQGNGSGADIAASSYGGIIEYTSFQADWLITEYEKKQSLTALVEKEWTYFSINQITLPDRLGVLIGWTGSPASTSQLVKNVLALKVTQPDKFQQFLQESQIAIESFLTGVQQGNISLIFKGIKQNRHALARMGEYAGVEIETALLAKLSDLAEQMSCAGKQSGAGGGDCGIAFITTKEKREKLIDDWVKAGIKPLNIQPYQYGPVVI